MTGPRAKRLFRPVDLPALAHAGAALARASGCTCVLIGGGAMQAYGLDQATNDVDFAVRQDQAAAVERAARAAALGTPEALANQGLPDLVQRAARAAMLTVRPLKIGGFCIELPEGRIDFIDRRHGPQALFEEAVDEAKRLGFTVDADGLDVLIVPLEYLVALKMVAARPRDEADLDFLLRSSDLDYRAAREIVVRHLGETVARYLDRAARLAGRQDARLDYDDDS